jgi:hypothetical protein
MTGDRDAEHARLETLVAHAEKRFARAVQRLDRAGEEKRDAADAHDRATSNLGAWIEANPDPQSSLIDLITPEGESL